MSVQVKRFTNMTVQHPFFPHSTIRLCPCPPPRRGHTCLCLLWEPVYPVQMLLLFSHRHAHLSGPCQGHTASTLPPVVSSLMSLEYAFQLLDYYSLNACSYCMWTADSLLLHNECVSAHFQSDHTCTCQVWSLVISHAPTARWVKLASTETTYCVTVSHGSDAPSISQCTHKTSFFSSTFRSTMSQRSLWMCPHRMSCLMKLTTMCTVSLRFQVSLWAQASPPLASLGRTWPRLERSIVSLDLGSEPVSTSLTVASMTCLLWLSKSFLTLCHPPPPLLAHLAASLSLVMAQVTYSGGPRFPASSTRC